MTYEPIAEASAPDTCWVITGKLPGSRLSDLQPFWQRVPPVPG
jgi:hypothetical protein